MKTTGIRSSYPKSTSVVSHRILWTCANRVSFAPRHSTKRHSRYDTHLSIPRVENVDWGTSNSRRMTQNGRGTSRMGQRAEVSAPACRLSSAETLTIRRMHAVLPTKMHGIVRLTAVAEKFYSARLMLCCRLEGDKKVEDISHPPTVTFKEIIQIEEFTMKTSLCQSTMATTRVVSLLLLAKLAMGYLQPATTRAPSPFTTSRVIIQSDTILRQPFYVPQRPRTSLQVWWFGGTEQNEVGNDDDSCELVAVRIERTSANSRRIAGEIIVPATMEDVWSILTDYDRLAIHVPNLMESRIIQRQSPGDAGDGNFRCRLYQKGAQKIIGFDFSASVTMDMTEKILSRGDLLPLERSIGFKCVDSQFFKEFDGRWTVKERMGPDGTPETVCSYTVDVRPKGPVPVAALEWRIREDVPTNLRAVKAATMRINAPNTLPLATARPGSFISDIQASRAGKMNQGRPRMVPALSDWDRDETMGKYL